MEIIRQNLGKRPTKFGIVLDRLKPRYQKILKKNPIIRNNSTDDRFLNCIFKIEDRLIQVSYLKRVFIEPKSGEISSFKIIRESYHQFDWNCTFCNKPIKSRIDNYEPGNFTCTKCENTYIKGTRKIPRRIIEESLRFTEHVKTLMKNDQKKIIKYIKKNDES
jgi:hypothetical protein